MKDKVIDLFARLRHCDQGAALVEYGIILGLAVMLGATALQSLTPETGGQTTVSGGPMSTGS